MDRKEKKLLNTKTIQATPVNSSIKDVSLYFVTFKEVSTTRQNPNKFDDVFKMCCELFCFIMFCLSVSVPYCYISDFGGRNPIKNWLP